MKLKQGRGVSCFLRSQLPILFGRGKKGYPHTEGKKKKVKNGPHGLKRGCSRIITLGYTNETRVHNFRERGGRGPLGKRDKKGAADYQSLLPLSGEDLVI